MLLFTAFEWLQENPENTHTHTHTHQPSISCSKPLLPIAHTLRHPTQALHAGSDHTSTQDQDQKTVLYCRQQMLTSRHQNGMPGHAQSTILHWKHSSTPAKQVQGAEGCFVAVTRHAAGGRKLLCCCHASCGWGQKAALLLSCVMRLGAESCFVAVTRHAAGGRKLLCCCHASCGWGQKAALLLSCGMRLGAESCFVAVTRHAAGGRKLFFCCHASCGWGQKAALLLSSVMIGRA
jgi:hypothetical protein